MSQVKQNIRVRFAKEGDIRFISHHDLMRVFERALRRARLPVAMSEGYHPRLRISLPAALSVGHTGLNEVADVGLAEWMRPDEFRSRLQAECPKGLALKSAEATAIHPGRQPSEYSYRVPLLTGHCVTDERLLELLGCPEVVVTRRRGETSRRVEIRRFIKALRLDGDALLMLIRYGQEGTARPEEVLEALGCRAERDYRASAVARVHVNLLP